MRKGLTKGGLWCILSLYKKILWNKHRPIRFHEMEEMNMKREYSCPKLFVENFTPNAAVAACTSEGGIEWTFDCLRGPITDNHTVVASGLTTDGCDKAVGYAAGVDTAWTFYYSYYHSRNSSIAQWGSGTYDGNDSDYSGRYLSVTYTGAQGLLYADATGHGTFTTNEWSTDKIPNVVAHSKHGNRGYNHTMIAPVINTASVNASW